MRKQLLWWQRWLQCILFFLLPPPMGHYIKWTSKILFFIMISRMTFTWLFHQVCPLLIPWMCVSWRGLFMDWNKLSVRGLRSFSLLHSTSSLSKVNMTHRCFFTRHRHVLSSCLFMWMILLLPIWTLCWFLNSSRIFMIHFIIWKILVILHIFWGWRCILILRIYS